MQLVFVQAVWDLAWIPSRFPEELSKDGTSPNIHSHLIVTPAAAVVTHRLPESTRPAGTRLLEDRIALLTSPRLP